MRLILLILALGSLLPLTALYPHVGLLLWGWLTMMQPHQEVWGLPGWLQLNLITAIATIGFWLISREPKLPRFSALPVLLALLCVSMIISQVYSLNPNFSWRYFDRDIRVLAFVFLCTILLQNRTRIHAMLWVLAISIGYYAALGGAFTLMTGGKYLVLGPAKTMIADNNHVGLAFVTIIPLLNYLRLQSHHKFVRFGITITMVLSVFAVFGTFSRGAMISFVVMAVIFLLKSRNRIFAGVMVICIGVAATASMSDLWGGRMQTIAGYEEDTSFQGRVDAWIIATEVAMARPFVGAGLRVPYLQDAVDPYLSEPRKARAAHSIYFELLGSLGFPGLVLLLAILYITWRDLRRVERLSRNNPQLKWAQDLASMGQVSLLAFMVGGAALSLEFWEGFWLIAVFAHCTRGVVEAHFAEESDPGRKNLAPAPVGASQRIAK